jgi:spermidine synthase
MNGPRLLIYLLFFASGASGLIYEVVWVRQFGLLFGSTVYSAAVVTSIYMCGLGIGGYLAGRWVDRRVRLDPRAPVRAYGLFELGIALFATAILFAVPHVAEFAAQASSYVRGANGWYVLSASSSAVRYGSAIVLLTPITLLMGGTLTLLIRHLVGDDIASAGRSVGILYGINTAGAALGCLLTDTAFVPALGLQKTQFLAIGLNLFAAIGALALARRTQERSEPAPAEHPSGGNDRSILWVCLAIALSGFSAMAMQILWFRHLVSLLGGYRPVFSILLTVILVGIWLGSLLGGALSIRTGRPGTIFALALSGFVIWSLAALWGVDPDPRVLLSMGIADPENGAFPFYAYLLGSAAWVVGPPALLTGMAFPLANAVVQRSQSHVGERAGLLYLANTIGGVSGSLLAGFWLLPLLGIQGTASVAVFAVLIAIAVITRAANEFEPPARLPRAIAFTAALVAALSWALLPERALLDRTLPPLADDERVVAVREGVNETIAITDRDGRNLRLLTNGHNMSATGFSSQRYMRAFAHLPMFLSDGIENVMVMCFGVGNTANALLMHPSVARLDVVDLSSDILEHSKYFEAVNGRPLEDPRVRVHVNDARQHLRMSDGVQYDLITGEPPPIAYAGVSNLYSRDFFELAHARLRSGGFVTYWMPMNQIGESVALSAVAAFIDVFPGSVMLSGYRHQLILIGRKDASFAFDPKRMRRIIDRVPGLYDELRWVALEEPIEVVAMLAGTYQTLSEATQGSPVLTDDRPLMEYGARSLVRDRRLPADLFSLRDAATWCPECGSGALDPEELLDLQAILKLVARYYRSPAFLEHQPGQDLPFEPPLDPRAEGVVARSLYFQDLVDERSSDYFLTFQLLRHGKIEEATRTLEAFVEQYPTFVQGRVDLGDLYLRSGRTQEARTEFEAARALAPSDRRVGAGIERFLKAKRRPPTS